VGSETVVRAPRPPDVPSRGFVDRGGSETKERLGRKDVKTHHISEGMRRGDWVVMTAAGGRDLLTGDRS
jgi:hypothetical protein